MPWLRDQALPGTTAAILDGVKIGEQSVREEALAQVEPDPLDWVQLQAAGGAG